MIGSHIWGKTVSVPLDAYEGLTGAEVAWDGRVRCGANGALNCHNTCFDDDNYCYIDLNNTYTEDERVTWPVDVYTYTLIIKTCAVPNIETIGCVEYWIPTGTSIYSGDVMLVN